MRLRELILPLLLLWPVSAWAGKAIPPSPYSYVHNENVVSAATAQRLSATLRGVEQSTGHQFVVALFQSLDGESLEDYTNKVFRAWKIGGKRGNDGLLFALYKTDRRWRVEVGYGFEGVLTDLEAAELARRGVPSFKGGDFDGGVVAVVDALAAKISGQAVPPSSAPVSQPEDLIYPFIILLVVFWVFMAIIHNAMLTTMGKRARHSTWFFSDFGGGSSGGWSSGGGFSGGGGSSGGGGASGGW